MFHTRSLALCASCNIPVPVVRFRQEQRNFPCCDQLGDGVVTALSAPALGPGGIHSLLALPMEFGISTSCGVGIVCGPYGRAGCAAQDLEGGNKVSEVRTR